MPIELNNVYFSDKTKNRLGNLRGLSLTLADGELVAILGGENSGKSALGALIDGLILPDSGSVTINGSEVRSIGHGGRVGYVPRCADELLNAATVEKEVGYALGGLRFGKAEREAAIRRALELVGLEYERFAALSPFELSRDDQRRLAIASVLVSYPETLILDEPTEGTDAAFRKELPRLLRKLKADGVTVLLLTEDPESAAACAERVVILQNGRIVRSGSTKTVFSEYYDLVHLGVDGPQVRRCIQLLRTRGVDMPTNIIDYEQFIDRLKIIMWRKTR